MKAKLVNESVDEYSADKIYKNSLSDSYWKSLGDIFPGSNIDTEQTNRAVKFILNKIKNKYKVTDSTIIGQLENKIHAGIT